MITSRERPSWSPKSRRAASVTTWGRSSTCTAEWRPRVRRLAGARPPDRLVREPRRAIRANAPCGRWRPPQHGVSWPVARSGRLVRGDKARVKAILQQGLNAPSTLTSWPDFSGPASRDCPKGIRDTHNLLNRNNRPAHPLLRPRGGLRQRVSSRPSCSRQRLTSEGVRFTLSSMTIWPRAYVGVGVTPETAPGIHCREHVRNDSSGQEYQKSRRCQVLNEKKAAPARCRLPGVIKNMSV